MSSSFAVLNMVYIFSLIAYVGDSALIFVVFFSILCSLIRLTNSFLKILLQEKAYWNMTCSQCDENEYN